MGVPYDLLNIALGAVGTQSFKLKRWISRSVSDNGLPLDTYAAAITCEGQIQPAEATDYELLGLNYEKELRNVWCSEKMSSLEDDKHAPDLLLFDGRVWQIKSITQWNSNNGWQRVTVIIAPPEMQGLYE